MASKSNYAVLLGDLNDFIAPGQACVNPVFAKPSPASPAEPGARPVIAIGDPDAVQLAPPPFKPKKAEISLSDCLACSGCVTSAETVLMEQQSAKKFLDMAELIQENQSPFRVIV